MTTQNMFGTISRVTRTVGLSVAVLTVALAGPAAAQSHAGHDAASSPSSLVQIVRDATRPYLDVNAAVTDGYLPAFGCVSGPQEGAMGVHYIKGPLVADGELDASKPEAVLYEFSNGRARLLGVEYIVDAATWLAKNPGPPSLEGQAFQLVGKPNRYALESFFELHVWAWRDNPFGTFVDWNPRVSCDGL